MNGPLATSSGVANRKSTLNNVFSPLTNSAQASVMFRHTALVSSTGQADRWAPFIPQAMARFLQARRGRGARRTDMYTQANFQPLSIILSGEDSDQAWRLLFKPATQGREASSQRFRNIAVANLANFGSGWARAWVLISISSGCQGQK